MFPPASKQANNSSLQGSSLRENENEHKNEELFRLKQRSFKTKFI